MTDRRQHTIRIDACYTFGTRVFLDDVEVKGVADVQWNAPVNERQRVTLTLLSDDVTVTQKNSMKATA